MMARMRPENNGPAPRGGRFTMIELVVVIGIMGFLGALMLGVGINLRARARVSRTRSTIEKLETLLEELYAGDWPEENEWITNDPDGTEIAAERLGEYGSELDVNEVRTLEVDEEDMDLVVDAWGGPIFVRQGGRNQPGLDIWSKGPDGESGTEEDIVNWTRSWRRE